MKPYDKTVDYLGPQGTWITKYIPKVPPSCEVLHPLWNRVAYDHDVAYSGSEFKGFMGWIRKWINKDIVEEERRIADLRFRQGLRSAVEVMRSQLTPVQFDIAIEYAEVVYFAVKKAGWAFYKVGGE